MTAEADHPSRSKVVVAISAFRSDAPVIDLVRLILSQTEVAIHAVVVVDSLGSGGIADAIARHGWQVHYENSDTNLGSAGNLARRMELASELGGDWVYCLNHDGKFDAASLSNMLLTANSRPKVGAVYPLLYHTGRKQPWEDGRRSFLPSAGRRFDHPPSEDADDEVLWSSSNGALYNLAPRSDGIQVWPELWMGYEDLGYGMALHRGNWKQLMCRKAVLSGVFDYRTANLLGRTFVVPDKPFWYCYYGIRNLLLIQRKLPFSPSFYSSIAFRLSKDALKILLLERKKIRRLSWLFIGVGHGIIGRSGKGMYP